MPAVLPSCQTTRKVSTQTELTAKLVECGASIVLGVHAYRAGRFLLDCGLPFVIVLGGTDMNENVHEADKADTIRRAVAQAAAIVAFDTNLLSTLLKIMPGALCSESRVSL